jgi:hypothetical protein
MTTRKPLIGPLGMLALLLGQASVLWGALVAMAYWVGFALLVPQGGRMAATHLGLPLLPPALGLALGAVGLALARLGRHSSVGPAIAGLVLNALAFALAEALHLLR